jgi:hypothetical protein
MVCTRNDIRDIFQTVARGQMNEARCLIYDKIPGTLGGEEGAERVKYTSARDNARIGRGIPNSVVDAFDSFHHYIEVLLSKTTFLCYDEHRTCEGFNKGVTSLSVFEITADTISNLVKACSGVTRGGCKSTGTVLVESFLLLALTGETHLHVQDSKRRGGDRRVYFKKGELLLCKGDLVHAGGDTEGTRFHCKVVPESAKIRSDSTYYR